MPVPPDARANSPPQVCDQDECAGRRHRARWRPARGPRRPEPRRLRSTRSITLYWPPAPPPRRPRPAGAPIVGSPVCSRVRARRRPAIDRPPVLNEPHIRTQRVAGQVLGARVAPELTGLERRVAAYRQQRLVSRVGLQPPGEARQIVVALDHQSMPNVFAISFALMMPSSVSSITTTSMLSLKVFR